MNAPDPVAPLGAAGSTIASAPLDHFVRSLTNRTHSDKAYLQELADSIKQHGVIQPITARPWPASRGPQPDDVLYEIVIGEGRWIASRLAGLATIPFFWRDLTDEEALELQLVENLKRKNLTAIEEAEGYRRLMKDHGHTAESVGELIGKSRAHVYARLKLLDLCPAAYKLAQQHGLNDSVMLLAARIPDEKLQIAAIKRMAPQWADGDAMSERAAKHMVRREYMLKLADAPFSRTTPDLIASAGSCHDCPKRTGNAADLFTDVDSPDVCTDPGCYEAKAAAHVALQKKRAKLDGVKVLDGNEARKAKPHSHTDDLAGGLVDLDAKLYVNNKQTTLRKALGADAPKADVLIVDPHEKGHTIEAVARASIADQLKAKGITAPGAVRGRQAKSEAEKAAEKKAKRNVIWRQRLWDSLRGKIAVSFDTRTDDSVLDLREFRQVAGAFFDRLQFEDQKRLARLWIGPDGKSDDHDLVAELAKRIEGMTRLDAARLMLEASMSGEVPAPSYSTGKPEKMLATAQALEIDADALMATLIAEERAKDKPAAKKKAEKQTAKVQPNTAKPAAKPGELAAHLIYCHPDNPGMTWSGKGQQPAWVKQLLAAGRGLEVRDRNDKPVSTPVNAARAGDKGATAAPAEGKAELPKKAPKKPKSKADPAPALPANEAAAPPKTGTPNMVPAWPFPQGARP